MKNLKNILALLSILPGLACSDLSPQENRPDSPGTNPPAKEEDNRTDMYVDYIRIYQKREDGEKLIRP